MKVPYTNAVDHAFYSKRRKAPRFPSVADLTSSAMVNVRDSPPGVATSNLRDEEDRIAMVCNSVPRTSGLSRGSSDGLGLSLLDSVTASSRHRRKAYQTDSFSAANVVDPCMLGGRYSTPILPVSPAASDICRALYPPSSEIRRLVPEAGGPRHSASVEEFETSEMVSADWDEESVSDCSLEEDYDVCSVSELKTGIIDDIQAPRTSWVEFLDSGSILPNLETHHAEPPFPPPRKAVATGNSRRHIRIYGNLLEQQDESTPAVHLEEDYVFKAFPDIMEQESGLLPDCTRHSGLRALVLPDLVAQRISAGINLPLDSPEPLDCSSIVSAFPETDGFERSSDVVPVLKSGGLESLRALIVALESISPEIESSDMGLSPSMSSPTSDLSSWDKDSAGEANVSWGIAT